MKVNIIFDSKTMKRALLIIVALLIIPGPVFALTLLSDSELAAITGQIGKHFEEDAASTAYQIHGVEDIYTDSQPAPETSNAMDSEQEYLPVHSRGCGISIYIIDVLFDIRIGNIAYGDTDSS